MIVALTVFLTIVLVLAVGIGLSYAAAMSWLRLMGHRPQKQPAALAIAELGSSGD